MTTRPFKSIVSLAAIVGLALPAWAQIVRINFSSEVAEVSGPLLPGVGVGSIITGEVEVDLAKLPPDSYPDDPSYSFHFYSGMGLPGYIFRFNTGFQTYTLDSVNAATGLGIVPAISLLNFDGDLFDIAARHAGNPYGALLSFSDFASPANLLRGDYFPEDINLAAGLANATFKYSDFLSTNAVVAKVTSTSMVIEQETPAALLIYRVRVSSLPQHLKRTLTARLNVSDAAFAKDRCAIGLRQL